MSNDHYYLKADHQTEWSEVTKEQFIAAEQAAGFQSKFGPDHVATGGFSGRGMRGQVRTIADTDITPPPPEQPAPEGDGWRYVYNDFDQHGGTCDRYHVREPGNGDCIAHAATKHAAETIITDHRLAALVPGLVEALRAAVITMQFAGDSNKEVVADRAVVIQECLDALAAAKERAGASDGDTKRFYSDKANRGYGPHSDQD